MKNKYRRRTWDEDIDAVRAGERMRQQNGRVEYQVVIVESDEVAYSV